MALGDWQDPSLAAKGGEAAISLRYTSGKKEMPRDCKLRCAKALSVLRTQGAKLWEEVPEALWAALAAVPPCAAPS